jgi:hypothetical protein
MDGTVALAGVVGWRKSRSDQDGVLHNARFCELPTVAIAPVTCSFSGSSRLD